MIEQRDKEVRWRHWKCGVVVGFALGGRDIHPYHFILFCSGHCDYGIMRVLTP